jgi:arabinofuranosyltransferase
MSADQPIFSPKENIEQHISVKTDHKIVLILFTSFFAWLLAKNSWYGDDAFITFRVIDNFANGLGLVWNTGERVQAFTHPLWLLLMTPVYTMLKDPYQTIYWVSYLVSLVTIYFFLSAFTKNYQATLIGGLFIAASMAFIDYCSSGLENPLTHLLLIIMLILVLKQPATLKTFFLTGLVASLAAVNRLDTILFYIPVLGYQLYETRASWQKALALGAISFTPLIAWEVFALIYYGFPFPNTYYTKIASASLHTVWLHEQALNYARNSFQWDPITLVTIALSMIFVIWEFNTKKISILLGMVFYLYYVYSIGGDFMSGRFFSALFLVATTLLMTVDYASLVGKITVKITYIFVVAAIIVLGMAATYPPIFTKETDVDQTIDLYGIANEKLFYFNYTNWYVHNQSNIVYYSKEQDGINFKNSGGHYVGMDAIGLFGYYAGSDVYILDYFSLADPLRSRLPASAPYRIGHSPRVIPFGYEETLRDHFNNHLTDLDLHLYYDKLSVLIHDDIFASGRWQEIINFNIGKYDYLIRRYNNMLIPN